MLPEIDIDMVMHQIPKFMFLISTKDFWLVIEPLDPGIVFEKIIVDFGGYRKTFLYGGL